MKLYFPELRSLKTNRFHNFGVSEVAVKKFPSFLCSPCKSFPYVLAAAELHKAFTYDSHHFRLYFTLSDPIYKLGFLTG